MKNILVLIGTLVILGVSCVDEVEDINPPRALDSPGFVVSPSTNKVLLGGTIPISIAITDVPGKIDSIAYSIGDDLGTLVIDQAAFDALKGEEKGSFSATYTAPIDYAGDVDIFFTVYDAQKPRKLTEVKKTIKVNYIFAAPTFDLMPEEELDPIVGNTEIEFTLESIKAPGGIGEISYTISGGKGIVEFNEAELNAAIGKTEATVSGKFKTNSKVGTVTLSLTVTDNTPIQRSVTHSIAVPVKVCSSPDYSGTYNSVASGKFKFAAASQDSTYKDLSSSVMITQDVPGEGVFTISDVSFGLYEKKYLRGASANPIGKINVCDGSITRKGTVKDKFGATFTLNGKINIDNSITITWSNTVGDTGELKLTKQ